MNTSLSAMRFTSPACAALVLGLLASPASFACRMPPSEQTVTPEQQIALASDVSVARVVRATVDANPGPRGRAAVEYEFEVQQRILGFGIHRFILAGAQGETRPSSASSNHGDPAFWQRGGGRLYNDADCVLRPDFILGEYYLVFRGKPATWRSFEHIPTVDGRPDANDPWLAFVIDRLKGSRN